MVTLQHGAMSTPAGSLMEHRQNMAKSMAGFLEKPAILFAMFFNLELLHYQMLPPNSLFRCGPAADRACSAAQRRLSHELRTPPSSHGIACSGDGDGGNDDSNSYSSGGGDDDYGGGGVDGDNGGGGGNSDGIGHKQQTTIN